MLAPIILFTYKRLSHTRWTVEALQKNDIASESTLFIYADAPRNEGDRDEVNAVRTYLHSITGFQKINIVEHSSNQGLTNNILGGVDAVINAHGKCIVLEDDIVVSPHFLRFMNEALDFYESEKKVWHITGHQYPINTRRLKQKPTAFTRQMGCWGWATWKTRWQYYEKDAKKLVEEFSAKDIYEFDFHGKEGGLFWRQVINNLDGRLNTWAIFWYATIFQHKGLCLEPIHSLVDNIGLDGSGEHCTTDNAKRFVHKTIKPSAPEPYQKKYQFPQKIIEDPILFKEKRKSFYPDQYDSKQIFINIITSISIHPMKRMGFYMKRYSKKPFKEKFLSIGRVIKKITKSS